jgi:hypothetical protein
MGALTMSGCEEESCAQTPDRETARARVRDLNDALRCNGIGGQVMLTQGVQALGVMQILAVVHLVLNYAEFTPDDDPCGEHDFGSVEIAGQLILWKIDCYDLAFEAHSPGAADPLVTRRVLTIMLAEEW